MNLIVFVLNSMNTYLGDKGSNNLYKYMNIVRIKFMKKNIYFLKCENNFLTHNKIIVKIIMGRKEKIFFL